VLCIGKNGFGKSTFIDAITFALYGKPFRRITKGQLVNSINKSDMVTEIEFIIGSNKYKVIRGIKPNIFEVYCNDVLVKQDAKVKDYQEQLERYILKMNYKSFTQVVILGSARYTPFMQLSAADRRSVIEDLLDIQIFSIMNSVVKDKLSVLKESIQDCKYNIDLYKSKIELQKHNIKINKQTNDELILKKQEIISNTNVEIQENLSLISDINNASEELLNQISDMDSILTKKNKLAGIEFKINGNISKFEKENTFFISNNTCPTCRQIIDEAFKQSTIETNNVKLAELEKGNLKLQEEFNILQDRLIKITSIKNLISNNNITISKITSDVESAKKYIQLISNEVEGLRSSKSEGSDDNEKLQELIESLDVYVENYESYITDKSYFDFISLMLKDGGIKTKIIKQYLPILNKYINQYLSQMDFFANFNITENFEEIIKSRYRDEFTYASFSEGQKIRIDLAILFSFRQLAKIKNSVNTNLLILDEIMDSSLDIDGTDVLMNLIPSFDNNTNIFVISHKSDQLAEKFNSVLKFDMVKNFSRMKATQ
jgi:DNA repair exonuclease SbcCD ATPase subunit